MQSIKDTKIQYSKIFIYILFVLFCFWCWNYIFNGIDDFMKEVHAKYKAGYLGGVALIALITREIIWMYKCPDYLLINWHDRKLNIDKNVEFKFQEIESLDIQRNNFVTYIKLNLKNNQKIRYKGRFHAEQGWGLLTEEINRLNNEFI